jgi:hypothetical protein
VSTFGHGGGGHGGGGHGGHGHHGGGHLLGGYYPYDFYDDYDSDYVEVVPIVPIASELAVSTAPVASAPHPVSTDPALGSNTSPTSDSDGLAPLIRLRRMYGIY